MRHRFIWLALLGLGLAACPKDGPVSTPQAVGPQVVAPQHMWLRNAFDKDPSMYLGRFVPDDAVSIDESSAMPLTCSQHVKYRRIDGGGVIYDETFNASTEAALRVGIPQLQAVGGMVGVEGSSTRVVRVRYELTGKMVAEPTDPAAFEACCKQAPDQCTKRYIGEFLEGKGAVYYSTGSAVGADAGGTYQGIGAEVEVKNGVAWARSIEFPNPVFFAFKTTENRWSGTVATGGCGDWVDAPPRSSQGKYFVGVSDPVPSERIARDAAMGNARVQAVRFIGEEISSGTVTSTALTGDVGSLTASLENSDVISAASSGVATYVKDEAWCVVPEATPEGQIYVAKVLAFLPKTSYEAAADAVAGAAKTRPIR